MNPCNFPGRKADKKKTCDERKAISDTMTPQQRLAELDKHGFTAKRERARLRDKIERTNLKKPEKQEQKAE